MKNNNLFWLIAAIVAIVLAVLGYSYFDEQNDRLASQSEKIAALEEVQKAQASAPTEQTTTAVNQSTTASADYNWGWEPKETKILLPDYVCAGDVTVEGVKYYDEGGINEATLVVNQSSRGLATFSEWGAGEFKFTDKNSSITEMVRDEFANGGDPDARTVRVVVVTNNKITQTWYNSQLKVIRTK